MVDLDVFWPEVFSQELDTSYRPGIADIQRRGLAIVDGLLGWLNISIVSPTPDNFGLVIMKLAQEARIYGVLGHDFEAALEEWIEESDEANPKSPT